MRTKRNQRKNHRPKKVEGEYIISDNSGNWESESDGDLENFERHIITRGMSHSVSKISSESDEESEHEKPPVETGYTQLIDNSTSKIEHIFLSRESSNGTEYLVTLQNAEDPFAQWIPAAILLDFSNYPRQLQKFNETEMNFSFYSTMTQDFDCSFRSPLHVISHRPFGNNPDSGVLEYLFQFDLETGTAFFWEPKNSDAPETLINYYMKKRKCVINGHPDRPQELRINPENADDYKSVDGKVPRDYQIEGVNWMLHCFTDGHGCILADEMGLGKTIQTLVFLTHLDRNTQFHGPHLIAVRTNTFAQWCHEIERWTDMKYIAYTGDPGTREIIQDYQMPYVDDQGVKQPDKHSFNILLVTYDIFLKDSDLMQSIDWQIVFVDEGHRIKNCDGKKHNALSSLQTMHRIILTGTPIQSTMLELWTLLQFVSPNHFPDSSCFPADDVESLDQDVLMDLKRMIAPHLLRRSLIDVERSIIPKDERIAFLQMTQFQLDLTRLTKLHELWRIKSNGDMETQNETNMLQRICNHPFLIDGAEQYLMGRTKMSRLQLMINCSSKFILLDRILPVFKRSGRSVLIFSQKVKVLKLLSEYCHLKKYTHEMLIGELSDKEKKSAISHFCDTEKDIFIFLISTRSGAEGLNLTKANITIIFDPDWNPQNDIQALGRCHRIGQTQKVDVIRLLTYGTYEHEMYSRAQRKLKLWSTLLGDGKEIVYIRKPLPETTTKATPAMDSLIAPVRHKDTTEFEGFAQKAQMTQEEESDQKDLVISAPPDLALPFDHDESSTFENIIDKSATIVNDIQLTGSSIKNFPRLDLGMGISDENFLKQFPIDSALLAAVNKKKSKPSNDRVPLDAKTAKRIIRQLELHGYGEWENIYNSINSLCPIDQLIKFCQAATLLHLRACEPSRVSCYPLLLHHMSLDIPNFNITWAMCGIENDWYSIFSKRSYLSGEGIVCKQISGHIHKTCVSFLSKLEHHLLIAEWRKDDEHPDFPFNLLPPYMGRTMNQDKSLYHSLISGQDIGQKDTSRVGQICVIMKSQLLLRSVPVGSMRIEFWSLYEVNSVINALRNFGTQIMGLDHKTLLSKTALLSKTPSEVHSFIQYFVSYLHSRDFHDKESFIFPETITKQCYAPEVAQEPIIVNYEVLNDVIKRIYINAQIRKVMHLITINTLDLNQVLPEGKEWMTLGDAKLLLEKLVEYGCDSLSHLLLSPDLSFRSRLTPNDINWLSANEPNINNEQSKIPIFLLSDRKFHIFLKSLIQQYQPETPSVQPQPKPSPPVTPTKSIRLIANPNTQRSMMNKSDSFDNRQHQISPSKNQVPRPQPQQTSIFGIAPQQFMSILQSVQQSNDTNDYNQPIKDESINHYSTPPANRSTPVQPNRTSIRLRESAHDMNQALFSQSYNSSMITPQYGLSSNYIQKGSQQKWDYSQMVSQMPRHAPYNMYYNPQVYSQQIHQQQYILPNQNQYQNYFSIPTYAPPPQQKETFVIPVSTPPPIHQSESQSDDEENNITTKECASANLTFRIPKLKSILFYTGGADDWKEKIKRNLRRKNRSLRSLD